MPRDLEMITAQPAGSAALVVNFADIEMMTGMLRRIRSEVEQQLGELGVVARRPDLIESLVLSPLTGMRAETALAAATARLQVHLVVGDGLMLVAVTVISTYELADRAIAASLEALVFMGRVVEDVTEVVVDVLQKAGAVVVGLIETDVALRLAVASLVTGFLFEFFHAWIESFEAEIKKISDPGANYSADPISMDSLESGFVRAFSADHLWNYTTDSFEVYLGVLGPGYDLMLEGLIFGLGAFGMHDGGALVGPLSESDKQALEKENAKFLKKSEVGAEQLDGNGNVIPTDIQSLLMSMAQIGYLGGDREAVIRVVTTGNPPVFTLMIPPTEQWIPNESEQPNDLNGNLSVMNGSSLLTRLSDEALESAIAQYNVAHPGAVITAASSSVMLAGFSQGGATAAAMAQNLNQKYNIKQVVTMGAPISRFEIPPSVKVLAYEARGDIVPKVDGGANSTASNWQTISGNNGGGMGSHDGIRYANMAANGEQPRQSNNLDEFFSADSSITDYYAKK